MLGTVGGLFSSSALARVNRYILYVPFPAGGGIDSTIRLISGEISRLYGYELVINNVPGASGLLAWDAFRSSKSGYALPVWVGSAAHYFSLQKHEEFALRDPPNRLVTALNILYEDHLLLASQAGGRLQTLKDVLSFGKRTDRSLLFGTTGGRNYSGLYFRELTKTYGKHLIEVSFRSLRDVGQAIIAGDIDCGFIPPQLAGTFLASKLHLLATTGKNSLAFGRRVPLLSELIKFDAPIWQGLFVHKSQENDPTAILLSRAVSEVLLAEKLSKKFELDDVRMINITRGDAMTYVNSSSTGWANFGI